jgi:hypothetical protein
MIGRSAASDLSAGNVLNGANLQNAGSRKQERYVQLRLKFCLKYKNMKKRKNNGFFVFF